MNNREFVKLTGFKPTQTQKVKQWLNDNLPKGQKLGSMSRANMSKLIDAPGIPENVRDVIGMILGKERSPRHESIAIVVLRPQCPKCKSTELKVSATYSRTKCREEHNGTVYTERVHRLTICQKCDQRVAQICLENPK